MIDRRHFIALSAFVMLSAGTVVPTAASSSLALQTTAQTTAVPVRSAHGMVVSGSVHASQAGADVLAGSIPLASKISSIMRFHESELVLRL